MTRESRDVLGAAMKLPVKERAEVVAELLASLEGEADEDVEAAWAAEIERRARRAAAGEGDFEDWEAVRDQLRPES